MFNGDADDDDHQPLLWLRGHAVYAAHFLVLVFVGSLLVTSLLMFSRVDGPFIQWLQFSSPAVLHGQVWRLLSYGLVNPPSLQFVIDMLMFVWFGREVERAFGRRTFLAFYVCIYLVSPLLFTLIGLWLPVTLMGETGAFALFVAFATLYPEALLMFNILAKWAALVLVGIFSLMALAYHDWSALLSLWATTGFAWAFVRHRQGHLALPDLRFWRRGPQLRVLPDLPPAERPEKEASRAEMDRLLDKIAQSGLASLTPGERARLARARENMLK
jgi:membrane associated rhomboid family serine protease